jgi:hypothetical protein
MAWLQNIQIMEHCLRHHRELHGMVLRFDIASDREAPNSLLYESAVCISNMQRVKKIIGLCLQSQTSENERFEHTLVRHNNFEELKIARQTLISEYKGMPFDTAIASAFLICDHYEVVRDYVIMRWHEDLKVEDNLHNFKMERICMQATDCIMRLQMASDYVNTLKDPVECLKIVRNFDAKARLHICGSLLLQSCRKSFFNTIARHWFQSIFSAVGDDTRLCNKSQSDVAHMMLVWYEGGLDDGSPVGDGQYMNIVQQLAVCSSVFMLIKTISRISAYTSGNEKIRFGSVVEESTESTNRVLQKISAHELKSITMSYFRNLELPVNEMQTFSFNVLGCDLSQFGSFWKEQNTTNVMKENDWNLVCGLYAMLVCLDSKLKKFLCNVCRQDPGNYSRIMQSWHSKHEGDEFPYDRLHQWIVSEEITCHNADICIDLMCEAGPEFFDMVMRCSIFFQTRVFQYCPLELKHFTDGQLDKTTTFQNIKSLLFTAANGVQTPNLWDAKYKLNTCLE